MKRTTIAGVVVGGLLGLALGVGAYTFIYAKGASYLTNNPKACINCHIMQDQYDGWINSSHRSVASCNDCHTPAGLVPKYWSKAQNGFWHSFYFTTGNHPDPIQINERNRRITEDACRKCHAEIVHGIEGLGRADEPGNRASCLHCHRNVGHAH
jgi:cytochrome c nitrite reductase small subunit